MPDASPLSGYTRTRRTACHLLGLSIFATINESSFQLALLLELAMITRTLSTSHVAAYAAILSTSNFALSLFNFLLVTTMAQVGKAVGAKRWEEIGPRFRVALCSALLIGCLSAVIFAALETPIFEYVMALDGSTLKEISAVFKVRLILLPLMMIQRVCSGLLGGYGRVKAMAFRAVSIAIAEIASQYIALYVLDAGLFGATVGTVITAAFGVILSLVIVAFLPPSEANGHIELCNTMKCGIFNARVLCDFACASKDTLIRSLLLTASVYSMSLVSANLGSSQLAAHQVAMNLWMLMSLICDGIADVGTIVCSSLYGQGDKGTKQILAVRDILVIMGVILGAVATILMFLLRDYIIDVFKLEASTAELLVGIWPIICGMQIVNAAVFVLDGFIYGVQAFSFVRNLMLIACVVWFAPALTCIGVPLIDGMKSLFAVWCAKAVLNLIRGVGATYLLFYQLPKKWKQGTLQREEESAASTGSPSATLKSPLLDD